MPITPVLSSLFEEYAAHVPGGGAGASFRATATCALTCARTATPVPAMPRAHRRQQKIAHHRPRQTCI